MQWWSEHEAHFPHIALMALKYLAAPASSAPSERIFSQLKLIIDRKRWLMDACRVERTILMHKYDVLAALLTNREKAMFSDADSPRHRQCCHSQFSAQQHNSFRRHPPSYWKDSLAIHPILYRFWLIPKSPIFTFKGLLTRQLRHATLRWMWFFLER